MLRNYSLINILGPIMHFMSATDLVYADCFISKYFCQPEFAYERVFGAGPCPGPETR